MDANWSLSTCGDVCAGTGELCCRVLSGSLQKRRMDIFPCGAERALEGYSVMPSSPTAIFGTCCLNRVRGLALYRGSINLAIAFYECAFV